MSIALTFGLWIQNLELQRIEPEPNTVTGFVDLVENTGMLIKSDIIL